MRRLGDMAASMLERTPAVLERIPDPEARGLVADCAAAVREVADEPGDRLLHWDLHDENVLAADRAPWLAIDPKPLAGDPGFDLWPALANNFDPGDVLWRFDAMTEVLGLDPRGPGRGRTGGCSRTACGRPRRAARWARPTWRSPAACAAVRDEDFPQEEPGPETVRPGEAVEPPVGFEPTTCCLQDSCSDHLS